jgi:hypothetical protein
VRRLAAFWLICAAVGFALVAGLAVALGLAIDSRDARVAISAPERPSATHASTYQPRDTHRRLGE